MQSAIQFVSNVSSMDLYWSPAQLYTIPLAVTVPSNCSLRTALKINAPLGISAVATLTEIEPVCNKWHCLFEPEIKLWYKYRTRII